MKISFDSETSGASVGIFIFTLLGILIAIMGFWALLKGDPIFGTGIIIVSLLSLLCAGMISTQEQILNEVDVMLTKAVADLKEKKG
jgi:hypothetical protein